MRSRPSGAEAATRTYEHSPCHNRKSFLGSSLGAVHRQLPDFVTIPAGLVPAKKGFDDYRG